MDGRGNMKNVNYKGQVNFYKHQTPNMYNPGTEYNSGIYQCKCLRNEVPFNFIGRKTLRHPTPDYGMYNPSPMGGVWKAQEHIPIMRTQMIKPHTQ